MTLESDIVLAGWNRSERSCDRCPAPLPAAAVGIRSTFPAVDDIDGMNPALLEYAGGGNEVLSVPCGVDDDDKDMDSGTLNADVVPKPEDPCAPRETFRRSYTCHQYRW